MSFEVFLTCYEGGQPADLDRGRVRALFPVSQEQSESGIWLVKYGENSQCEIYVGSDDTGSSGISSLMVSRPCADPRLWDALYQIMKMGNVVFFFGGCAYPLVANTAAISHLPADMIESLGPPRCVDSGDGIVASIQDAE